MSEKYMIFKNNGEVSPQEIKTFGMSIKKEGAIGFFGTGLKYAIAISCRLGNPIRIFSGEDSYSFYKTKEEVRGKAFDFIDMFSSRSEYISTNEVEWRCSAAQRLAFTTHVGAKWEPWMCIREVLCNCLDEGGSFYYSDTLPEPVAGTTFVVMSGQFVDIPLEEYTLPGNRQLLMSTNTLDIYNARSSFVYYKGIRIEHVAKPYRYTYNIKKDISLGEDRVAHPYYIGEAVITPIIKSDNEPLIKHTLQAGEETGEGKLDYSGVYINHASDTTKQFIRVTHKNDGALNDWATKNAPTLLTEDDQIELFEEANLNEEQVEAFAQALTLIAKYFDVHAYKVRVVAMADHIYGKAYIQKKIIALNANRLGSENVDQIKMTILEEYLHCRFEADDYGRAWQDGALRMMLELIEHSERKARTKCEQQYR